MKLPPASTNLSKILYAMTSLQVRGFRPDSVKVIVPRHSLLTLRPELPRKEYSILCMLDQLDIVASIVAGLIWEDCHYFICSVILLNTVRLFCLLRCTVKMYRVQTEPQHANFFTILGKKVSFLARVFAFQSTAIHAATWQQF